MGRWRCGWRTTAGGSFADVSLHDPLALLAGDVAAPVVLAVAALHQLLRVRVVATAAAHQVAAVTAQGGFVALPGRENMKADVLFYVATAQFCFKIKRD